MTGIGEAGELIFLEGLNTLIVRQSSDIFPGQSCGKIMGSQREKQATRMLTSCMHAGPKLVALNDAKGARESLSVGRAKRRFPTGGSAKGRPKFEGMRKRIKV
jgi:hypothetical protein